MLARMLLPVAVLLLYPLAVSPDAAGDASRGRTLVKSCEAELRLLQPGAIDAASQSDLVSGSYCIGYVNGFLGGLLPTGSAICTAGAPMISVVEAYVRFMERNPQLAEEDKRVGLRQSLEASFPCPAAGSDVDLHARSGRQNRL
jgi:hypothetical protein